MNRFIFTILCAILVTLNLSAQSIYEQTDTGSYTFTYVPYQKTANNKVLNQLALAHLKIPEKANILYSFRYRINVNYSQSDSLYIYLDVSTISITGDNKIKDYDISSLLQPAEYDINYSLEHPGTGTVFEKNAIVTLDDGIVVIGSFPDSLWQDGAQIKLTFNAINFNERDFRRLETELAAIRDYYASSALIDTLQKRIQSARKNTTSVESAVKIYSMGLKGLYLLKQSMDNQSSVVPGADPLNIAGRYRILAYNFTEYLDYIKSAQKPIFTGNLYEKFSSAYIESIRNSNILSRQVDYYSSPFFYKLFANSIFASQFKEAKDLLLQISAHRKLGTPDFRVLSREILRAYLEESNRLLEEKRYGDAVDLLTGSTRFINFNPYGKIRTGVELKLAEARKGLILSYTEIIRKSLDKNLVSLASNYLTEVEKYIERYGITNDETGPFRELYIQMADIHAQLGYNALSANDYQKALSEFSTSIEFLNGYESAVRTKAENGLSISVRTLYNNDIQKVRNYINSADHEAAEAHLRTAQKFASSFVSFYPDKSEIDSLEYLIAFLKYNQILSGFPADVYTNPNANHITRFCEAKDLAMKYNFSDQIRLDTLINSGGRVWLNQIFSKGRLKYWASETDSAMAFANEGLNLATRLGLNREPDIISQYDKLMELAGETYCNKAKGEYNSLLNQASDLFSKNKFTEGLERTDQARELAYQKALCGLSTGAVNKLIEDYRHPLRWNKMVSDAFALLNEKRYRESADLIQQAESVYSYYRLDTLHIAPVGYFDVAERSQDKDLLRHAIGYILSKGDPDKALILLEKLRVTGYTAESASDLQESVARKLGTRDLAETPDLNVKLMLANYTKGDKWYARFENVYRYYTRPANQPLINRTINKISDDIKDLF